MEKPSEQPAEEPAEPAEIPNREAIKQYVLRKVGILGDKATSQNIMLFIRADGKRNPEFAISEE